MSLTVKIKGLDKLENAIPEDAATVIVSNIRKQIRVVGMGIRDQLRELSPVDTGAYKRSWRFVTSNGNASDLISSVSIKNPKVQATAIEGGSTPGEFPWPSPTKGRKRVPVNGRLPRKLPPKTVMSKGRIWSTQAVGGTISKVITEKQINNICVGISKIVVKGIVHGK